MESVVKISPSLKGSNGVKTKMSKVKAILTYVLYSLPLLVFLFPVFLLVSRSFFTTSEIISIGAGIFPKDFHPQTYVEVFENAQFLRGLKNTLIVVACNVIGVPTTAYMAAFAFTKVKFSGRGLVFKVALATIMLPGILLQLPVFRIFTQIGWTDSLLPLTVPCFFGGGIMNIFMIMQFIRGIPKEMDEAAILDGTNLIQRMTLVTLPNIKAIIMFIAVNAFFGAWNDIMGPLMYVLSDEYFTVNLYIYKTYLTETKALASKPNEQMAIGVILMLPMVVVFMFYQNTMIEGFSFAGIKG